MGAPSSAPETPDNYSPAMDDAAGLEAYRTVRAATPDPAPEPPPAPGQAPPPSPLPDPGASASGAPSDDLPPEDAKLARVLNRIERLEQERNTAQRERDTHAAELAKARERAAFADKYEQDLAEFREDPERFFKRINWDRKTIEDYVTHGPSKVDAVTSTVERKTAELQKRLDAFEAADRTRASEERVSRVKAGIPPALASRADTYPHVLAFYENPSELADAIMAVAENSLRTSNRDLTLDEAAASLEKTLIAHSERLNRARSKPGGTPAAAPSSQPTGTAKPTAPTLTNTAPAAAKPPPPSTDQESDDDLLAGAVARLRAARTAA